ESVVVGLYARDPLDEVQLESVRPMLYDDVTVLPRDPPPDADPETVDAETLMVLLHLRKLQQASRPAVSDHGPSSSPRFSTQKTRTLWPRPE
ncbi:MAG: hypothetical protein AAFX94_23360, partial [Myxococcota bacterium]